ncbi:MAG: hypothetical protein V3S69_07925 [Dehalococcoidales bacterium]
MSFIKTSGNKEIVNLDNVTYIYPSGGKNGGVHRIYFVYNSMNESEVLETIWCFEDINDFNRILGKLPIKEL